MNNKESPLAITTFDPPGGSLQIVKAIEHDTSSLDTKFFDFTTYLSYPTLFNTFDIHLGSVYELFSSADDKDILRGPYLVEFIAKFNSQTGYPLNARMVDRWPRYHEIIKYESFPTWIVDLIPNVVGLTQTDTFLFKTMLKIYSYITTSERTMEELASFQQHLYNFIHPFYKSSELKSSVLHLRHFNKEIQSLLSRPKDIITQLHTLLDPINYNITDGLVSVRGNIFDFRRDITLHYWMGTFAPTHVVSVETQENLKILEEAQKVWTEYKDLEKSEELFAKAARNGSPIGNAVTLLASVQNSKLPYFVVLFMMVLSCIESQPARLFETMGFFL